MTPLDPSTCRRALREIGEIAAVAGLQDSQMTDQEALQAMAAIADWVIEETPAARAACGDVIRELAALTEGVAFETLDDRTAQDLFTGVLGSLQRSRAA